VLLPFVLACRPWATSLAYRSWLSSSRRSRISRCGRADRVAGLPACGAEAVVKFAEQVVPAVSADGGREWRRGVYAREVSAWSKGCISALAAERRPSGCGCARPPSTLREDQASRYSGEEINRSRCQGFPLIRPVSGAGVRGSAGAEPSLARDTNRHQLSGTPGHRPDVCARSRYLALTRFRTLTGRLA
jgi:hypothetical protein